MEVSSQNLTALEQYSNFVARHIGIDQNQIDAMLSAIGAVSMQELIEQVLPESIRIQTKLDLPAPLQEHEALAQLKQIASNNKIAKSLIGMGYADTLTPAVIMRNLLENPGWYTAYTPYQAEIAQGRLEALLNFQQMVMDLTGLELANASLLDEATAAAEAMSMARRISSSSSNRFFVDRHCYPQTLDVLRTRARYFGFELVVGSPQQIAEQNVFGVLLQYPDDTGEVVDLTPYISVAHADGAIVAVATDPMALVLLKSPGEMGADIAFGSSQRFGIPLGFGGPHAAFFATRDQYKRNVPGRIIGVSVDSRGKKALRMALQTREQHIRREKANSNICTSQVLLANMAAMYAIYHGPQGLRVIAERIHRLTCLLSEGLRQANVNVLTRQYFDSIQIELGDRAENVNQAALAADYNLRRVSSTVLGIALNEKTTREDVTSLIKLISGHKVDIDQLDAKHVSPVSELLRQDVILTHPVFNSHHSEHKMLRYLKKLQNRDMALDHSMIALGSCTMKLNATSEMMPISWPEFSNIHPFAPSAQTQGYIEMIGQLKSWLKAITGFDAISMQPNSGAQGEYAGLAAIRRYQVACGESQRHICLIPKSAHGTNPASAHMCGLDVVVVDCDANGNVDVADLGVKAAQYADQLSCLMVTYPSTHGVFEQNIQQICATVHQHGGQVYMDGANLNAQLGYTTPVSIGADVSHINLHKTFCIPHGGGGPGMGPIGVKAHLAPYLPGHFTQDSEHAVSAAPFGSAGILPISWMYIAMMGGDGLRHASAAAILNANYISECLKMHYTVLYVGQNGRVAHECIIDIRPIKSSSGITESDIAKRLMDYGFHAPTVSFPVAGTMMIEPTESESKDEIDRFIAAMISIRDEISQVESGQWSTENNPLKHAPHTQEDLMAEAWDRPYSRQQAAFPLPWVKDNKFWPSVNRIDDVYGDRNLFCACAD